MSGTRVYFIVAKATSLIKIGISTDVEMRRRDLQSAAGIPLEVALTIPGIRADEARLHRRFYQERTLGEWFRDGGLVREFLDKLLTLDEAQQVEAIQEQSVASAQPEDLSWEYRVYEIVTDALFAAIRHLGVGRVSDALTKIWGPEGRPVRPALLNGVLEGDNYFRAEWLPWFSRQSGAVRDAMCLIGVPVEQREYALAIWQTMSALRSEVGDERADEIARNARAR